jgi:chemotaxis protein MotB
MSKSKNNVTIIYRRKLVDKSPTYKRTGTWKVAYADFITAMMAFFLMLWLLSVTPENTLQGVAQYFAVVRSETDKTGGEGGGNDINLDDGMIGPTAASSSLVNGSPSRGRRINQQDGGMMSDVEKQHFLDIMNTMQKNVEIQDYIDNISVDVTDEGLRIQIMDSDNRPVFKPNTYELQPYMNKVLSVIGKMIKDQPNYLALSGHTASVKDKDALQRTEADYWFLSAMRANEIRKFLTKNLIKDDQVARIVGRSDKEPFDPKDKYSPKNIRVSITLLNSSAVSRFQQSAPTGSPAPAGKQKNK